jgi:hypothetical protein
VVFGLLWPSAARNADAGDLGKSLGAPRLTKNLRGIATGAYHIRIVCVAATKKSHARLALADSSGITQVAARGLAQEAVVPGLAHGS